MKQKKLNKKSDRELLKMRRDLEMDLVRASSTGAELVKNKKAGIVSTKGMANKGTRTKLKKQLRKAVAQINNTLSQRGLYEKKHISKRRKRRLRGRIKK